MRTEVTMQTPRHTPREDRPHLFFSRDCWWRLHPGSDCAVLVYLSLKWWYLGTGERL
jgi:hypothetical protein